MDFTINFDLLSKQLNDILENENEKNSMKQNNGGDNSMNNFKTNEGFKLPIMKIDFERLTAEFDSLIDSLNEKTTCSECKAQEKVNNNDELNDYKKKTLLQLNEMLKTLNELLDKEDHNNTSTGNDDDDDCEFSKDYVDQITSGLFNQNDVTEEEKVADELALAIQNSSLNNDEQEIMFSFISFLILEKVFEHNKRYLLKRNCPFFNISANHALDLFKKLNDAQLLTLVFFDNHNQSITLDDFLNQNFRIYRDSEIVKIYIKGLY